MVERERAAKACDEVAERTTQALKFAQSQGFLLNIAIDHLTLSRVELYRDILSGTRSCSEVLRAEDPGGQQRDMNPKLIVQNLCEQRSPIANALEGLRGLGNLDELPHGLLTRAWARFAAGDHEGCGEDLDEAWEIAERSTMKLFMSDIQLYRARLFHDLEALEAAAALIAATGYHRRDEELADAEAAMKDIKEGM